MKITSIEISNFRSLREIKMGGLSNFVVVIGKNSSGKSNILEGLAFAFENFAISGGTTAGLVDYLWFNKIPKVPINFTITVKIDDHELSEIFPNELVDTFKRIAKANYNEISFSRKIIDIQGNWKTAFLKWNDLTLVLDDKQAAVEELNSEIQKDMKRLEKVFTSLITPQILSTIYTKLSEKLKGRFRLIPAVRDVKVPQVPSRMTVLDAQIQNMLWTWDQSVGDTEQERYGSIDSNFEKITKLKMDLAAGQVYVRRQRRIPLTLEGGGVQATLNLAYALEAESEKKFVYGIEEPESHCHFEFQRKTFEILRKLSDRNQVLIATHSPVFIDRSKPEDSWMVRHNGSESLVGRISSLKEILEEVGAKPSDLLFYANKLLFVEGKSDEIILKAFAKQSGLDFTDVLFVPLGGKTKVEKNLRAWVGITRDTLPLYVVLDADAKNEAELMIKEGLIHSDRMYIWRQGAIESYYPIKGIETALLNLNARYDLGLDIVKVMSAIKEKTNPAEIDLGEREKILDKSWEVLFATEIANYLEKNNQEVPYEVAELFGRLLDVV